MTFGNIFFFIDQLRLVRYEHHNNVCLNKTKEPSLCLVLDRRAYGEVISLSVTNPRITEWLKPESVLPNLTAYASGADLLSFCAILLKCLAVIFAISHLDTGSLHNSFSMFYISRSSKLSTSSHVTE